MAEFALNISSRKATLAVGKYPSMFRTYLSSSRAAAIQGYECTKRGVQLQVQVQKRSERGIVVIPRDRGPNSSSGVE